MQRRGFPGLSSRSVAAGILSRFVSREGAQGAKQVSTAEFQAELPQWQAHDFSFYANATSGNPFEIAFSAEVTGPSGLSLTVPGFYDGQGIWKVRIAPNTVGLWSLMTASTHPDLDKRRASFSCTHNRNGTIHGGLQIDRDHPSQFVYEDGTRFFPMGYECDWLWALDTADPKLTTVNPFLDKISGHGFNF